MYCIDPTADEPIMMLDRHIGFDSEDGQGIDGSLFAQELLQLDAQNKKSIQVYINCPGGSVIDGMNIYNAILKSKTPVDTHNVGIAASMGGVCFMAGRKRIMSDYASLMLHNPSGSDDKKAMDSMRDSLTTMLSAKANITPDAVGYLMEKTSWLNSAECFAKGFATDIAVTSEHNKKRMPQTMGARALWKTATEIVNNSFKIENDMKKITAKLNLNEAASEESIVTAIEGLQNNLTAVKDAAKIESEKMKAEKELAEKNVTDMKAKLEKAEADLKAVTDKAAAAAALIATESKALDMVTAFAKVGRIKNEATVIDGWKKLAVVDFDGTKKMIEDLPLNKIANKIETTDTAEAIKSAGTAQGVMFAIQNRLKNKTA